MSQISRQICGRPKDELYPQQLLACTYACWKKNNCTTVFQGHLNIVVQGLSLVGKSLQEHFWRGVHPAVIHSHAWSRLLQLTLPIASDLGEEGGNDLYYNKYAYCMKGSSNLYEYLLKQEALMRCQCVLTIFHAAPGSEMCCHPRGPLGSLIETQARPIQCTGQPSHWWAALPSQPPSLASFSAQRQGL